MAGTTQTLPCPPTISTPALIARPKSQKRTWTSPTCSTTASRTRTLKPPDLEGEHYESMQKPHRGASDQPKGCIQRPGESETLESVFGSRLRRLPSKASPEAREDF